MKVLHVAQPTTAGVPRVVADLVADQRARGWVVAVACPEDGDLPAWVRERGARLLTWSAGRDPGPAVLREVRDLRTVLAAAAPELVHLHSAKAGLAGRLALRGSLPTVFQPHAWSFQAVSGPVRAGSVAWERFGARWADALVVVSQDEQAAGEAAGVRGDYVRVRNGVDVTARRPRPAEQARRELGLDDGPLAVCVGRLSRQKGQDVLLQAWPAVAAAVPGARLALVGDGPDREALAGAAGRAGVLLPGASEAVDTWLSAADVVVLPSRWEAGLSLVAMEAMALARSVIATEVAGAAEGLLPDCGAVVAVGDAAALGRAVVRRLQDPELARAEGVAGRERVEREHDLRVTAASAADLYARVLAGR